MNTAVKRLLLKARVLLLIAVQFCACDFVCKMQEHRVGVEVCRLGVGAR